MAKKSEETTVTTAVLDDEMPPPTPNSDDVPWGEESATQAAWDAEVDLEDVEAAVPLGEPMPKGEYIFELKSYTKMDRANTDGLGPDPYFKVQWRCLDPRYAGRVVFDTITMPRRADLERARAGDAAAKQKNRNRLGKLKQLQKALEATGWNPPGKSYNVEQSIFQLQGLRLPIRIGTKERKDKDSTGNWTIPTGKYDNTVDTYVDKLAKK